MASSCKEVATYKGKIIIPQSKIQEKIKDKKGKFEMKNENGIANKMMDSIIKRFGFESQVTIDFCLLCETKDEKEIEKMYSNILNRA